MGGRKYMQEVVSERALQGVVIIVVLKDVRK